MTDNSPLTPTRGLLPQRSQLGTFARAFLAVLAAIALVSAAVIVQSERAARDRLIDSIASTERQAVAAMHRETEATLLEITADLVTFRRLYGSYIQADGSFGELPTIMLSFMASHRNFDQLRILSRDGIELLRVDNDDKGPGIIPPEALQDKSSEPYLRRSRNIPAGAFFISQMEFNREFGALEVPLKPVIRVITRLPGGDEGRLLVLNYLASYLLESLRSIGEAALGRPIVLSAVGSEGLSALDVSTPGELRAAAERPGFVQRYPAAWNSMQEQGEGVADDGEDGLVIFSRFYPADVDVPDTIGDRVRFTLPMMDDAAQQGGWYLSTHVDAGTLAGITKQGTQRFSTALALLAAVAVVLAWITALRLSNYRSDAARMRKLATRDALTGLLNRGEFERRLQTAIVHAHRHHRAAALLYVDLDGFKAVNDNLGHAAGDELLRHVADTLGSSVRESDLVGRIGGDEFAVALSEVRGRHDTEVVAQKLRDRLDAPIEVAGGRWNAGGSVGGATFPDDADGIDALFERADEAMYAQKAARKEARDSVEARAI